MAKHIISSNSSQPLAITGAGNTWIIDKSASIITAQSFHETALSEIQGAHDNTIVVNGAVIGGAAGDDDGIVISGRDSDVVIGQFGVVQGNAAVHAAGRHQSVENHGALTASWVGILMDHGGRIENGGSIEAGAGIWSNGGAVTIVNQAAGSITSAGSAIILQGAASTSHIINHGTIEAYYYAVEGSLGADIIVNRGVMKGTISLKDGNDVFDNRGGSVDHDISSNEGNDVLITDDAAVRLSEADGGGRDTVKSTVSYALNDYVENLILIGGADANGTGNAMSNHLDGNGGVNTLTGGIGKDRLDGHQGNDILIGGAGRDVFVFNTGSGHDTVNDFEKGIDRIDLRGFEAITSFADLKQHHLTDNGNDLVIDAGGDALSLLFVDKADLHASDFIF